MPLRIAGLVILLLGVIIQPVGWMFVFWMTYLSAALMFVGIMLLLASAREEAEDVGEGLLRMWRPRSQSREMPGDIHGRSGQLAGGRSTAWESGHSHDAGGGGAE